MSRLLLSAIAGVLAAASFGGAISNKDSAKQAKCEYEVIDLKEKVMASYYNSLDEDRKAEISFEQFSEGYYKSQTNIKEYTENVNNSAPKLAPMRANSSVTSPFNDYYDGEYMISNNHPDRRHLGNYSAPCTVANPTVYRYEDLPYEPNYNHPLVSTWYDYVEPGDIVIDPVFRGGTFADELITHSGIVEDIAKPYYNKDGGVSTFIRTIEAEPSGVRYGILDDERVLNYGTMVYRVHWVSQDGIAAAVNFCRAQLGKVYALTAGGVPSINQSHWYCNELVFAAYYHQGVNICETTAYDNYPGTNPSYIGFIAGTMIFNSDNVENRYIGSLPDAPSVTYRGRANSKYNFRIHNYDNSAVTVKYPKSSASFSEAITNAADSSKNYTVTIAANGSYDVSIPNAGILANAVVFSIETEGRRFMTLCTQLNNDVCSNFQYIFSDKISDDPVEPEQPTTARTVSGSKFVIFTPENYEYRCHGGSEWYELDFEFSISDVVPQYAWETVRYVSWQDFTWGNLSGENFSYNSEMGTYHMHAYMNNATPYGGAFLINFTYETNDGLDYISLSGNYRTSFVAGEFPNADGLVVTAHYRNGTSRVISRPNEKLEIYSSNYDIDHPGTYEYTVKYTERGITATKTYNVTVTSKPIFDYISLEGEYQTEFVVGDYFNHEGLRIIGHFSNNTTKDLTNYTSVYDTQINMNQAGNYGVHIYTTYDGYTRSGYYSIKVLSQPALHSISLGGNIKTSFEYGESFNSQNLVVTGHYTGDREYTIDRNNSNLIINSSNYNSLKAGTYTINVQYTENGVTVNASYQVTVAQPVVDYIVVDGDFQTVFEVGDEFNTDGLEVYAYLVTGQCVEVDYFEIDDSDVDMDVPGTYIVEVYGTFNGMTEWDFYEIEVVEPTPVLTAIALTGNYQTTFEQGDEFNADGLMVIAQYDNGNVAIVDTAVINSNLANMNQPGTYPIVVSYTENGVTMTSAYIITVTEKEEFEQPTLESITLSGSYKKSFELTDAFTYDGLIVTAHYSDGSSQEVTDFEVDSSAYNGMKKGTYTIEVSYTENGVTAYASYKVAVRYVKASIGDLIRPYDPIIEIPDPGPIFGGGKF